MSISRGHDDQSYNEHWDEKFSSRPWGRYPPEDLVRSIGRAYKNVDPGSVSVLEVGCGPGANLWFLHREGFEVSGIDCSRSAIEIAQRRLESENAGLNDREADLRVGSFASLPWEDEHFHHVVDVFAIYANTMNVIEATVAEIHRVLKPGGKLYSKLWGRNTTGFGTGDCLEEGTFDQIPVGPCAQMGVSHFFNRAEIERIFSEFETQTIDVVNRTDVSAGWEIEEYQCLFSKGGG